MDIAAAEALWFRILVGAVLVGLTAAIIFGGIRRISAVTEIVVPVMTVLYILLGLLVVVLNVGEIPAVLGQILGGAFGIREFVAGRLIGVIIQGMKRGLFSTEAGMGSAPNAGATAFIVLLSDPEFGGREGASLTQSALALDLVWSLAELFTAVVATINLVALVLLAGVAVRVLKNYEAQRKQGVEPIFHSGDVPGLSGRGAWDGTDVVTTRASWDERSQKLAQTR